MSWFAGIARKFVLFLAAAGFLFGQIFTGSFSIGGTMAGIGGLVAGILVGSSSAQARRAALAGSVIGLAGAALHVMEYYATANVPGNYYPWFLTLPFAAGLVVLGARSRMAA